MYYYKSTHHWKAVSKQNQIYAQFGCTFFSFLGNYKNVRVPKTQSRPNGQKLTSGLCQLPEKVISKAYVRLSKGIVKVKARSNFLSKQIVSKCIQGSDAAIESKRLKSEQNLVQNLDQIKDLHMRVATTSSQSSEVHQISAPTSETQNEGKFSIPHSNKLNP